MDRLIYFYLIEFLTIKEAGSIWPKVSCLVLIRTLRPSLKTCDQLDLKDFSHWRTKFWSIHSQQLEVEVEGDCTTLSVLYYLSL